jgi:hypothetical protein
MSYNGWTNYETWRVNLELFDDDRGFETDSSDFYDVASKMKEYVNQVLDDSASDGIALDYARAFIDGVNWNEIARHWLEKE